MRVFQNGGDRAIFRIELRSKRARFRAGHGIEGRGVESIWDNFDRRSPSSFDKSLSGGLGICDYYIHAIGRGRRAGESGRAEVARVGEVVQMEDGQLDPGKIEAAP